jgi:hypothetical protein
MLYLFAKEPMNNYRNCHLEGAVVCVCVIGVSPYMSSLSVTVDTVLRQFLHLLDFVPEYVWQVLELLTARFILFM